MSAIIAVHATATNKNPALTTPVATKNPAMASIGMQHAIIIHPWPPRLPESGSVS